MSKPQTPQLLDLPQQPHVQHTGSCDSHVTSLFHGDGHASNDVIVGAPLQPGEHGTVDVLLQSVQDLLPFLVNPLHPPAEENYPRPRPPEGLVCGGGHNIGIIEWRRMQLLSVSISSQLYTRTYSISSQLYTRTYSISSQLYTRTYSISSQLYTRTYSISSQLYTGIYSISSQLYTRTYSISSQLYTRTYSISSQLYTRTYSISSQLYTRIYSISSQLYTRTYSISSQLYTRTYSTLASHKRSLTHKAPVIKAGHPGVPCYTMYMFVCLGCG